MSSLELNERRLFKKSHTDEIYTPITISSPRDNSHNIFLKSIPHNILVITEYLNNILFTNDSFEATFNADKPKMTFPRVLDILCIKKNLFNMQEKYGCLFDEKHASITLYAFLERVFVKKQSKLLDETFVVYASHQQSNLKNLYEITIFKTVYDGEQAIALIFNDITVQSSLISTKAADASKDRLLATISHELKTPLNGILGGLNMALNISKDSEVVSLLNISKKSGKLLVATINSLLDLHLIRRNNLRLKPSRIHLGTLLEDITSLFESQCDQKGLLLTTQTIGEVPEYIQTDKDRLGQILINLLNNSIKFTHHGEVVIRVKIDPECDENILFEVADTGVGIKHEDQSGISTRMYGNGIEEETVGVHGVGLGLTICSGLAKLLNKDGKAVKCTSEPMKGSVFSFTVSSNLLLFLNDQSLEEDFTIFLEEIDDQNLDFRMSQYRERKEGPSRNFDFPKLSLSIGSNSNEIDEFGYSQANSRGREICLLNQKSSAKTHDTLLAPLGIQDKNERRVSLRATALSKSNTEANMNETTKGWVLLVDDNPFNLMVARRILEDMGYSVKTATDGEDAIGKVKSHKQESPDFYKLIVMDCQMPIMDGYEATREIRKLMESKEVPSCYIVALTANDSEEDKRKCRESGMDDVLSKPLQEEEIRKMKIYLKE